MTPKEKAEHLVVTMYNTMVYHIEFGKHIAARKCALIAVDEISNLSKIASLRRNDKEMELEFWIEVKQEIEKL